MRFFRLFSLLFVLSAPLAAQTPPNSPRVVPSGGEVAFSVVNSNRVRVLLRDVSGNLLDDRREDVKNRAVSVKIEAPVGRYTLQIAQDDKNRTPISSEQEILVPGIRREAGRWLFNGSPVIMDWENSSESPFSIEGLKRGGKEKLPRDIPLAGEVRWPFGYWGASARMPDGAGISLFNVSSRGISPLGTIDATPRVLQESVRDIESSAARSDAVILNHSWPTLELWPLKVARRVAEEQDNFDLPIFARFEKPTVARAIETLQAGATGIIVKEKPENLQSVLDRAAWLLPEAVTIEDAGVLDAGDAELAANLRFAGRMPLLARLPKDDKARREDGLLRVNEGTNLETLEAVVRATKKGATIYVEGLPERELWEKWGELTGTTISPLEENLPAVLLLEDPWFWGTLRGREFNVNPRVKVEIKQSMAAQTKERKGFAVEASGRALARLSSDPNGVVLLPIGSGRLIWLPHPLAATVKNDERAAFYGALAGTMGAAIVQTEPNVRTHLRASKGGVFLLGIFGGSQAGKVAVKMRGASEFGFDLKTGRTFSPSVRGNTASFEVDLSSDGYAWVALAPDEKSWEKEKRERRVKARLR